MESNPTHASFTSHTLLGRVRDLSDQSSWDEFVRRYTPRIFFWCKKFSLQDSDASDVTQQVLLKLVNAMQSFDYDPSKGSFRGWLKTITSNAVRDLAKRKSSKVLTGEGAGAILQQLTGDSAIDDLTKQIEAGYQEEMLNAAESQVQLRVKPENWQVWCLLTKQGKPAAEVAQEMNLKVADVYVAKSRILKMLKEQVARMESQERSN
jgi:RNA polymerase sigma-70 factor (ECF subfamily)